MNMNLMHMKEQIRLFEIAQKLCRRQFMKIKEKNKRNDINPNHQFVSSFLFLFRFQ